MPNHIYGIIIIVGAGLEPAPTTHGLSEIIRQFKTFSAKRINKLNNTSGNHLWHLNYYEHIIRNESDPARIREYIISNPAGWKNDKYYFSR